MTQKFELDPEMPAANQMKKTEFNLKDGKVYVHYHFEEGKITADEQTYSRDDYIGQAKLDTVGSDKDAEDSKEQQTLKMIHTIEMRCHDQIKEQERTILSEMNSRQESETAINHQRQQNNQEDIFQRILEKSIYMKARDKMKQGKKKSDDDTATTKERDYLAPILKKLGVQNPTEPMDDDIAMQVKNEALRSLKERLLTRAEIIQRRLDEEQKNLE